MSDFIKENLEAECLKVWYSSPKTLPFIREEIPNKKKKINEKAFDDF